MINNIQESKVPDLPVNNVKPEYVKSFSYNLNPNPSSILKESKIEITANKKDYQVIKNEPQDYRSEIENMWKFINNDIESTHEDYFKPKNHFKKLSNTKKYNKSIRIFVSSTFTDFFDEREILVKKVKKITEKILIVLSYPLLH